MVWINYVTACHDDVTLCIVRSQNAGWLIQWRMTSLQTNRVIRGKGRSAWWPLAADAAVMRRPWQRCVYPVVSDRCQWGPPVNWIPRREDRDTDVVAWWWLAPAAVDASSPASAGRRRPDSQLEHRESCHPPRVVLPAPNMTRPLHVG